MRRHFETFVVYFSTKNHGILQNYDINLHRRTIQKANADTTKSVLMNLADTQRARQKLKTLLLMQHKSLHVLALAGALALSVGAQAQTFQRTDITLPPTHRGVPTMADINNDGLPDLFITGEYWGNNETFNLRSWSVMGALGLNKGNGVFDWTVSGMHTAWEDWSQKESGEYDEDGNPIMVNDVLIHAYPAGYTEDEDGNITFAAYGLPPLAWNCTRWLDIDNDGNIDMVSMGEGVDNWQPTSSTNANRYVLAYRNGGAEAGYQFEALSNTGLLHMANERNGTNAGKSSISVADYDHDGYLDLVMQGYYNEGDEGERLVILYHNNGDGTFSEAKVFNPLPYDEQESPQDIYVTEMDDDDNISVTPTMRMKAMTHGAVMFGDLNGDGWVDIVTTGWGNGDNAGGCFYIYKNNCDGTFDQVATDNNVTIPIQESALAMADINNDGFLDIISTGSGRGGDDQYGGKIGDIYLSNGDFTFERKSVGDGNGFKGASEAQLEVIDFNHDGYYDLIASGWSDDWQVVVSTGNADGTFTTETDGDVSGLYHQDSGGYCFGNLYGDGRLNLVTDRYDGGDCTYAMKDVDEELIEAPEAPTGVEAACDENNNVVVTWDKEQGLTYNVYFRNVATGWISQLLPADTETGKLKTIQNMQTAVLPTEEAEKGSYSVSLPAGQTYEVGVQAIKADASTSAFTKSEVTVSTGVKGIAVKDKSISVSVVNGGIRVNAADNMPVQVLTPASALIATGTSNQTIAVPAKGVVLVKCNGKVSKMIVK